MISAVICMSFLWVWHLCNLPCVYSVLFWLISIARYVFKSPSICFWGTRYDVLYCERVSSLHFISWPGPGCDRTVCKWVDSYHGYHSCLRTFFFGFSLRLSREIIVHVNPEFISDESHRAFAPFQAKINLKFHVTVRSLIGLFKVPMK